MGFIENDGAVEVRPEPFGDLLDAARLALAALRAKRRIGGEEDAFGKPDRRTLAEERQRRDEQALLHERRQVEPRDLEPRLRLGDTKSAAAALQAVVVDGPAALKALTDADDFGRETDGTERHHRLTTSGR